MLLLFFSTTKLSFRALSTSAKVVILSERSEPKDPGIPLIAYVNLMRRSFDSVLRTPLRMTTFLVAFASVNDTFTYA